MYNHFFCTEFSFCDSLCFNDNIFFLCDCVLMKTFFVCVTHCVLMITWIKTVIFGEVFFSQFFLIESVTFQKLMIGADRQNICIWMNLCNDALLFYHIMTAYRNIYLDQCISNILLPYKKILYYLTTLYQYALG